MIWSDLLSLQSGFNELIPAQYAHWRPLIIDGLACFLRQLPASRQASLLQEQLDLSASGRSTPAERLVKLMVQCPTLHKLGQVIARQPALDPVLSQQLRTLEFLPAPAHEAQLLDQIRAQLQQLPDHLETSAIELDEQALAAGSVAFVLKFRYPDPQTGVKQTGVFKLLKPGIHERLQEELQALQQLSRFLVLRSQTLGLPAIDYADLLQGVERLMQHEIRLDLEQQHLAQARDFYANTPEIHIPRLLPWCTPKMISMEYIDGQRLTEACLAPQPARQRADTLVRCLLGQPFWTQQEAALFHADLHGGNIFLTTDGRLAILDWSLTAQLSHGQRQQLTACALAALQLDDQALCAALAGLCKLDANDTQLRACVKTHLDQLVKPLSGSASVSGSFPGFSWLLELCDALVQQTPAHLPEDFILLRKSWLSLSGVLHDLNAQSMKATFSANKANHADRVLLPQLLQCLAAEWPTRLFTSPDKPSADFASHLSNKDLQQLLLTGWMLPWQRVSRYWQATLRDLIEPR